jgi:hypothetical protein
MLKRDKSHHATPAAERRYLRSPQRELWDVIKTRIQPRSGGISNAAFDPSFEISPLRGST